MSGEQIKPGYKRTEVGVIPEEWCVDRIANLAAITTGDKNTQDRIDDGEYPFFVRSQTVERIGSYSFDGEAVLTAGDGVGTGKIFHYINGKFDFHQRVYKISDFSDRLDGQYFYKYFSINFFNRIMQMTAKSSVDSVRREMIADMQIPLPSTSEQRAIATVLSDVDALLAKLDQLIAKKRNLKQATMQQLLTGQTRLPGFSGAWEVTRLGDVGFANWGNVEITKDYYCESGFTAYSASGADGLVSWYEHEGEGVVLSAIGAQCGKSWLATGRWTPIKNTIWIKGLPNKLNSSFLYWISQSPDFWPTRGQAQPFIALGDVRNVFMPCPSLSEQIAIATTLSVMDAQLAALEARRDKTRALKQGMMQELLTGRIRLV